jgi:hypothetical protein
MRSYAPPSASGTTHTDDPDGSARALILELRSDAGHPAVSSIQAEIAKLNLIRQLELPADLFDHVRSHEIERYRQRVSVEADELRRPAEPIRLTASPGPDPLNRAGPLYRSRFRGISPRTVRAKAPQPTSEVHGDA